MDFYSILSFLYCFITLSWKNASGTSSPRIGVVGGGIGGTSSAFFLRELFGTEVPITVFEREKIGGRMSLMGIDGKFYEAGASVIHPKNAYMMNFAKELGLEVNTPSNARFGIYDGQQFVFEESDWSIVNMVKFIYRYGFSFIELNKYVKSMLSDFSRIYKIQDDEYAFTTVGGMLDAMSPSFRNMTQETLANYLSSRISSKLLIEELVQSVMMVNYGQTNNISAFVGFVSLAGADSSLVSIKGGNKLVPEGLLKKSDATLVHGYVTEITLLPDGTYSLKYSDIPSGETLEKQYDIIVIAKPFFNNDDNIKFMDFDKDFEKYRVDYHRTVATFVKGTLNPLAFNSETVPDEILTFKSNLLFNSIGKVSTCDGKKGTSVYKMFSQTRVPNLDALFSSSVGVYVKEWFAAYPSYSPPEKLPPFFLYPGLYYVNAIEMSASAMEMSAIGGRNAALLAYNLWNNKVDKVDHFKRVYKEEL